VAHNGGPRNCAGRNKQKCDMYRTLRKHERSHVQRIEKHIKKYKDKSKMAINALVKYREAIKTRREINDIT
jgi:hypothetical protein